MALRRIVRELKIIQTNPPEYCVNAGPIADDFFHWHALLMGASNTPYKNGYFELKISFPQDYPFKPPRLSFNTKIYHCQINDRGGFYLNPMREDWSPALTISDVLKAVINLINEPPDYVNALCWEIGKLYRTDKQKHDKNAMKWTLKCAQYKHLYISNIQFTYNAKQQEIKCNLKVRHGTDDKRKYKHNMRFIAYCEDYKINMDLQKYVTIKPDIDEYELILHKQIKYGSNLDIDCCIKYKDVSNIEIPYTKRSGHLIVDTLTPETYTCVINYYLQNLVICERIEVPMDIVNLCFTYFYIYTLKLTFKVRNSNKIMETKTVILMPQDLNRLCELIFNLDYKGKKRFYIEQFNKAFNLNNRYPMIDCWDNNMTVNVMQPKLRKVFRDRFYETFDVVQHAFHGICINKTV